MDTSQKILELREEITFQTALLISIDRNAQDSQAAEKDIQDEIKRLERKIREVRRARNSSPSKSRVSFSTHHGQTTVPKASPVRELTSYVTDEVGSAAAIERQLDRDDWSSVSTTSSNTSRYSTEFPSQHQKTIHCRKRSRNDYFDDSLAPYDETKKSRRTCLSPYVTSPLIPSTSSSDNEYEEIDVISQQKAMEDLIHRERMDKEFARAVQDGHVSDHLMSLPSASKRSAYDRLAGTHKLPSLSRSVVSEGMFPSRNLPWAVPAASGSFPITNADRDSSEEKYLGQSSLGRSEYSKTNLPTVGPSIDIASDNDSDIEIIPSSSFHENGRHRYTSSRPGHFLYGNAQLTSRQPEFSTVDEAASRSIRKGVNGPTAGFQQLIHHKGSLPSLKSEDPSHVEMTKSYATGNPFRAPVSSKWHMHLNQNTTINAKINGLNNRTQSGYLSVQSYGTPLGYTADNSDAPKGYGFDPSNPYQTLVQPLTSDSGNTGQHDYMEYVISDPQNTSEQIKTLLENIRPDTEVPPENREGTPEGLIHALYEHQKLALSWLKDMEQGSNKGGILADDMGLGKTISILALILSQASTDRTRKTTLIVAPVALLRQWEREMKVKIKARYRLTTLMIHGQGKKRGWDELRLFDVVLTTYGTLAAELKRLEKWNHEHKGLEFDQNALKKNFPLLGPRSLFYRVILDEAQYIKSKTTASARACCQLSSLYRFCLTGTPMMNNVGELYSLIHFLRIKPYNDWSRFQLTFGPLSKGLATDRDISRGIKQLQILLKAILLRRTKTTLIDGKPIITLPPKTEEVQHVVFDEDEQSFYNALESKTQIQFNKYLKAGTVGKHYSNILVLLLRLRQACCHPHLVHDFEEAESSQADCSPETMIDLARNLAPEVVERLLAAGDAFECPVCYDGVENPKIITPCGHDTCAECLTKITDQQAVQRDMTGGEVGAKFSKCPQCRGPILVESVINYMAFKKVYKPDNTAQDEMIVGQSDSDSETESSDASETESEMDEVDSEGNSKNVFLTDDIEDSDTGTNFEKDSDEADMPTTATFKGKGKAPALDFKFESNPKLKAKKEKTRRKAKDKISKETQHLSIAMLKKEAGKSSINRRRYMKYLKKDWQPSAKVTKCVGLVRHFLADGQKIIIFSQFVSLLDLLQVAIEQEAWNCLRYDGSMSSDARNTAIETFSDSRSHNIMLISLKAGNAGLNLVAASRVIILDPFWNPFIEMQAVDRAYRIGQQRPVEVHRILIQDTVEDRIIKLQEQKRRLVDSALDEGASKNLGRLNVQQLRYLFGTGAEDAQ